MTAGTGWRTGRAAVVAGLAVTLATCRAEVAEDDPVQVAKVEAVRMLEAADSLVASRTEYSDACPRLGSHPEAPEPLSTAEYRRLADSIPPAERERLRRGLLGRPLLADLSPAEREALLADYSTAEAEHLAFRANMSRAEWNAMFDDRERMQAYWQEHHDEERDVRRAFEGYSHDGWELLADPGERRFSNDGARLLWNGYEARVKASLALRQAKRYVEMTVAGAWEGRWGPRCPKPNWSPPWTRE